MIDQLHIKNYKIFKSKQVIDIKPLTIIIGKNSSGKSALLKLFPLIENSLSNRFPEALRLNNNGIEVGAEFRDLVYGRNRVGRIEFDIVSSNEKLNVIVGCGTGQRDLPEIMKWQLNDAEIDISSNTFNGFRSIAHSLSHISLKTDYISSRREGIERDFLLPPSRNTTVGKNGENVYSIIVDDALTIDRILLNKVSHFFEKNFEGWQITVNEDRSPNYQIELKNNGLSINLKDVGLGMIQALPLIVRAYLPVEEQTLIMIEEPELHLHPAAHGDLAQMFASSLEDNNKRYIIETHSQNFVLRLRRLIAQRELDKEQLVIYYVDFDEETQESKLIRINIDELGKPRNTAGDIYWPKNIFSETLDETSAIRTAQLERQNNDSRN